MLFFRVTTVWEFAFFCLVGCKFVRRSVLWIHIFFALIFVQIIWYRDHGETWERSASGRKGKEPISISQHMMAHSSPTSTSLVIHRVPGLDTIRFPKSKLRINLGDLAWVFDQMVQPTVQRHCQWVTTYQGLVFDRSFCMPFGWSQIPCPVNLSLADAVEHAAVCIVRRPFLVWNQGSTTFPKTS